MKRIAVIDSVLIISDFSTYIENNSQGVKEIERNKTNLTNKMVVAMRLHQSCFSIENESVYLFQARHGQV